MTVGVVVPNSLLEIHPASSGQWLGHLLRSRVMHLSNGHFSMNYINDAMVAELKIIELHAMPI